MKHFIFLSSSCFYSAFIFISSYQSLFFNFLVLPSNLHLCLIFYLSIISSQCYIALFNCRPFLPSVLGDPRTNQNPAFLTLGILFYRWHNVLAQRIQARHPKWRDEDVFQAARRMNIATLQVRINDLCDLCDYFDICASVTYMTSVTYVTSVT